MELMLPPFVIYNLALLCYPASTEVCYKGIVTIRVSSTIDRESMMLLPKTDPSSITAAFALNFQYRVSCKRFPWE